uniref:Uncharacterized protein n=1 Tax=Anopheles atroparvus TaxID=41427 RepID=A0A182JAG6_ANOAO
MSDNVKVSIKVRPLIKREKDGKLTSQWRIRGNTIEPIDACSNDPFVFDHIFDETVSTRELFDSVCRPVILSALNGINGTIFAYGQTSSGKTYTMIGDDQEPGVVPLTAREIFEEIKKIKDRQFLIRVGFIEIYNEKIHDLLNTANTNMKVVENQYGDVVVNSKECITNCAEQIIRHVDEGNKARKIGETNMNERSSRSHTIFRITIESRMIGGETDNDAVQIGILNLVDLAGSERLDQTGATGSRFKEGVCINRSLLSLSLVIQKLSENSDKQFINYRDSKLTRILQASLGGNAVTSMICNITPAAVEETYYTLSFANRAKNIRNKPKVNEILTDAAMMKRLEREIKRLQNELRSEQNKNSKIKLVELQQAITLRTNQFINSSQILTVNNDNARRRTWCPSSSEIPQLTGAMSSNMPDGRQLMGPPSTVGPYLVSMNGMTPNIAITTTGPDDDGLRLENGFRATLALMSDDDEHIPYRNLLDHRDLLARRQGRSITPPRLLNPFITNGEEFVPGEQISFGNISLSPVSSMAKEIHTPKSFRRNRRSSTGDSPPNFDYEKRCGELEQELIELQEFMRLEKVVELDCLKQELAKRDEALAGLREDIEEKEHRLEQLEERCTHLEHDLKDHQARVSQAESELALAVKERQTAVRQAEQHSNQLTGVEFEYERFRQRSEAREKELIESLQEARGTSGSATPNNADGFRLDQKREEMKRLEMQNYEFSLQLEECNKQLEQLKASYLEQQRKLEQVKHTVLQHRHHPAGGKVETIATQSLVQSLRKLVLSQEEAVNGEHVTQQNAAGIHDSLHERTNGGCDDANATTIGEEQTIQELLKIIETLEQSLKTVEQEKTSQAEANGAMMAELKSQLDGKMQTAQHLEKQLNQWKEKYNTQTGEYDEMSTQLMDQMQENDELRKEFEALTLKLGSAELEADARRTELSREVASLKETLERVTNEKDAQERVDGTLREEMATLKNATEEKELLVDTLEKEKTALTTKCGEITKNLEEAVSRIDKLNVEIEELKSGLEKEVNLKHGLEQLMAERTRDLTDSIDHQRAEKEALAKENARLVDEMELLQKNALKDGGSAMEWVQHEKEDLEKQLKTLKEKLETDRESFEKAKEELRLEFDRMKDLVEQMREEKDQLVMAKEDEVREKHCAERLALTAELEVAKQTHATQEQRVNELQQEVASYRSELQTIQKEYTALVEKEQTEREIYETTHKKLEVEIELSRKTIEAREREELEKIQHLQQTTDERIAALEEEVQRYAKDLEAAHSEHAALVESRNEEREAFENTRRKLMEEMEESVKTIERLTAERDDFVKRHSGDHKEQESLVERMQELTNGNECLERRVKEMEDEMCKHMAAAKVALQEKTDLVEQHKLDRDSYEAAQQKLMDEMRQLQSKLAELTEEKEGLMKVHMEGVTRQQSLKQQLTELSQGKDLLSRQIEEEIQKHSTELDTLRTELEGRNAALEKELDSLQRTVEQLLTENETLLKEQLEGEESLQQRLASEREELEKLRSCRDESERLVAQLERDLATVRAELEMVRSELLAEKRRHDESEQSEKVRLQSMAEEIEQLKRSIVALEDEKRRLLEAESRLAKQLDQNTRRTMELEEKQHEMECFREELRKENSDLTVAVQELSAKLVNLEEQMDGNEVAQRKTIDTLVREKQLQEDETHKHEQEASGLRQQLAEAIKKLADLQECHEKVQCELRDVRAALEESTTVRARLAADIEESSSVREVLERELRELKNNLEGLDSKQTKERYEQECQTSAKLRRELEEKQKELESFMATGRPSLGDGRVVQALRRENEDLLKQLNEARQIDGLKGKQLQERVDELQRLETEIGRMRDEMATMRHESSFNEKEVQISQLRQKVNEVEKVREETIHQKRSLERAYDQLRFKHQTLAKEVDELRRTTDKERKSRRQSTHDDRRGLIFNSKDVATITDPTSTSCSCLEMDAQIKELRSKLTLKDCQLNTQKLIASANPLKNEIAEMRRKLDEQNREKAHLEQELREVLVELDRERKERKRHCTQCIRHSRQQNARCDKAVQAYHPGENGTAVSVSIVSTTRAEMGTKTVTFAGGEDASSDATMSTLQDRCDQLQEQHQQLLEKYQMMKNLCRIRNEKIVSLGQQVVEKATESANQENECVKLQKRLKETEQRFAQRHNQSGGKPSIKSDVGMQTDTDLAREEMEMYRNKYQRYRALCQQLIDENKKNDQLSAVVQ